ncbi:MAG: PIN domain-containing protein, partial [Acidobacteriota bacterium]|nr:PIN domain-containing protein [Acidobacteriota bacterium]
AAPLWLSAVVLEELYAGAAAPERKRLKKLEHDFTRANRLLTPNLGDWARTGHILAQIGAKHGYEQIGRSRLTNDTLLAVSAARHGIVLVTANARDFTRIAEFCPLKWLVQ